MKEKNTVHIAALLAFLTASAYFLAGTVDVLIGKSLEASTAFSQPHPADRSGTSSFRDISHYAPVLDRGLFGDGTQPSLGPVPSLSSRTDYKLIGTIEGLDFAGAVLALGKDQAFYLKNRKMPDGSVIIKVMKNKVTLRNAGGELMEVAQEDEMKMVPIQNITSGVKKLSGTEFLVDQREVLASTENLGQILTQAQALPYLQQGKIAGFRIRSIAPGSIYSKIGLQNGDIIQQVNSQAIDDPAKFFQLYQGLRTERNISIDLLRNGQRMTMNYDIR